MLGLDRLDRESGRVTLHVPLPDSVQVSCYEHRRGNFWVLAATGSGLARLDRSTDTVTRYRFHDVPPGPNDLTGVMGMVEDDAGTLWFGSPGLGLLRFDPARGQAVHFGTSRSDPSSIPEDKVIALFIDREGNIWARHHSVPPSHFNPRQRQFETFRQVDGSPHSLQTDFINAMFEDDRGRLWIGNDFGLTRVDRNTGRFTRFQDGLSGKPMVITITQDRSGAIWVGTYGNGMARLDEATGRFERFVHDPEDPFSIVSNQVHRLIVSRDGTLWAGTGDGISRFDAETGRLTTFKADWSDSPILVIARDVTKRKATETALRRAETDLAHALRVATAGELTASIAHEINQPLAGILTNGEAGRRWLSAVPPNLAEGLHSVESIIADGRRAAEIINRIVALVRRTDIERRAVSVNDVINEAVAIAGAEIARTNVTIRLDLDKAAPRILSDKVQGQQVLLNLFRNALEAMASVDPQDRLLTVSSRVDHDRVVIGVMDTGPGLDAEAAGKVFDAFYSTKPTGMGLGLAISRTIVRAQGGEIRVVPNVQRGCLFEVELALLDCEADVGIPAMQTPPRLTVNPARSSA